jgi:hypothetical protein
MSDYPWKYWMDGDDGGGYDDGGGDGGGGGDDDDGSNGDDQDGDDPDQPDDEVDQDDQDQQDDTVDSDQQNDDEVDQDGAGEESSYDSDPIVDEDVFGSAEDYPNAGEADFYTDEGNWTDEDYTVSAKNLFGDHEYFGDTLQTRMADQGYQPYQDNRFQQGFDSINPGLSTGLHLFERQGQLSAFGVVPMIALELLRSRFPFIDFNHVDVGSPTPPTEKAPVQPLPPELASVKEKDAVDLRKYCSPIGDQEQTSRCSAFAWTHAEELANKVLGNDAGRLSPNYTMYNFQQMQGDAKDFKYAYKGGEGTINGPDPGNVLVKQGTCRQELWPDDRQEPSVAEEQLKSDASNRLLQGQPLAISADDVRKVLSAGMPVHVSMNTGPAFADMGRDGIANSAEAPSGQHGRHAMLIVGFTGNFYIIKNSWGTEWGDSGYCYVPRKILLESDPEFIAVIMKRPPGEEPPAAPVAGGKQAGAGRTSTRQPVAPAPAEPPKKKGWWPF